jgi:hypothetical protein
MGADRIKKIIKYHGNVVQYSMEARQYHRIIVSLPAEVVFNDKSYASTIENLSENGVYVVTAPQGGRSGFTPGTLLELKFRLPSGEKYSLNCRIIWSYQTPPHGFTDSVGMEIINPSVSYKELLKTLK